MNRKNIIFSAIIVNFAILTILFFTGLSTREEAKTPLVSLPEQTLPLDLEIPQFEESKEEPVVTLAKIEEEKPKEEVPLVYALPPLEKAPEIKTPVKALALPPISLNEVVVKKGDSLEKIAKMHHTSVSAIMNLNHLSNSFLKVGQKLKIPEEKIASSVKEMKTLEKAKEFYTIKVGENPWAIAKKHHMKVDELLKLNGLNEEKARRLKPGDELRVK